MSPDDTPNLVSALRPERERPSRYRWLWKPWLGAVIIAAAASLALPNRTLRGAGLVVLLFLIIGGVIAWLADASLRLSRSGREMRDYRWWW